MKSETGHAHRLVLLLLVACATPPQDGAGAESQGEPALCDGAACSHDQPSRSDAGAGAGDHGERCSIAEDCRSGVCVSSVCQSPSSTDSVKNGDETDVDCGGGAAPPCAVDKSCKAHSDCSSGACSYQGQCVATPSCTAHHGGDTCGPGEGDDPRHESCCLALPVTRDDGTTFLLDKYVITAGRMRAFIERTEGNVRKYIEDQRLPEDLWDPAWLEGLPSTMAEALYKLGPYPMDGYERQGCSMTGGGARTYWQAANASFPDDTQAYDKDILDEKALNCVEFFTLAAFCIWDGGHLATIDELTRAWRPDGRLYPWGTRALDADHVVHEFGEEFSGPYSYTWPEDEADQTAHIAPPGRKPLGAGPFGHMDLAGLVFQVSSTFEDGVPLWLASGSWEAHRIPYEPDLRYSWKDSYRRAYWATGGRCAR